jgi:hypothetical protein
MQSPQKCFNYSRPASFSPLSKKVNKPALPAGSFQYAVAASPAQQQRMGLQQNPDLVFPSGGIDPNVPFPGRPGAAGDLPINRFMQFNLPPIDPLQTITSEGIAWSLQPWGLYYYPDQTKVASGFVIEPTQYYGSTLAAAFNGPLNPEWRSTIPYVLPQNQPYANAAQSLAAVWNPRR